MKTTEEILDWIEKRILESDGWQKLKNKKYVDFSCGQNTTLRALKSFIEKED